MLGISVWFIDISKLSYYCICDTHPQKYHCYTNSLKQKKSILFYKFSNLSMGWQIYSATQETDIYKYTHNNSSKFRKIRTEWGVYSV